MKNFYKVKVAMYSKKNRLLTTIDNHCYAENHKVAKRLAMNDYKQLAKLDNCKYKLTSCCLDLNYGKQTSNLPF